MAKSKAKAEPKKAPVAKNRERAENRWVRATKVITQNGTWNEDTKLLAKGANLPESVAKRIVKTLNGVLSVLVERGAITPAWAKQLAKKPEAKKPATKKPNTKKAARAPEAVEPEPEMEAAA